MTTPGEVVRDEENDVLTAALGYAARGWPVLPLHSPVSGGGCSCRDPHCGSVGKHPRTAHGVKDATTDPATIVAWWRRWPKANVGVVTGTPSGLFALDIDGEAALRALKEAGCIIPDDACWQETGRGWQVLFNLPSDFDVRNTAGTVAEHVDTRGENGFIVAPPSLHANGNHYRWLTASDPGPAPAWLLDALRPVERPRSQREASALATTRTTGLHPYLAAALEGEAAKVRAATDGTRNATLNAAAFNLGQLEAAGLSESDGRAALSAAAEAAGLTETETARTFASGWEAGREQPRAIPSVASGADDRTQAPAVEPTAHTDAEPIDLGELLDRTVVFLRRFVVFPQPEQVSAVALWVAHTYVFELFDTSPYLAITSPEKRCGKSRVFELLHLLVNRSWRAVTPTSAVVYRKLAQQRPTLLLDEADAIFGAGGRKTSEKNEELRAVLNAGNRRGTTVDRCAGANRDQLEAYNIFSPKAFAGIGAAIPDTVTDRSVVVRMARKAPGEQVERFRVKKAEPEGHELRDLFAAWASTATLPEDPELPDELDDRAQDSWEVLVAIADAAGGEWPARARTAALVVSAGRSSDGGSLGVRLLADTRQIFNTRNADRLTTADLLADLADLEEAPWATLQQGETLKPAKLATLLRPYGIAPGQHRFGEKTLKGYLRDDFTDAWGRYLQPVASLNADSETKQGKHACKSPEYDPKQPVEEVPDVSPRKLQVCRDVSAVSFETGFSEDGMTSDADHGPEEPDPESLGWWDQEYGDSLAGVDL